MKTTVSLIIISIFFFSHKLDAQVWTRIQLDANNLVGGVMFQDTGIIISSGGNIIKSYDYFHSYTIDSGYSPTLFSAVSFPNRDTGYISSVYVKGGLLRTFDGGTTWAPMPVGLDSGEYIGDVLYFVSPDTGYAAYNEYPGINSTVNGGLYWTSVLNVGGNEVLRIKKVNDSTIYVLSNDAPGPGGGVLLYVIRSTDYGHTWTRISTINDSWAYGDMYFIDDTTIIVSANNQILKSFNGGFTFDTVLFNPPNEGSYYISSAQVIAFAGHDTGFAVCAYKLYKTCDAGNSWVNTNFSFDSDDIYNSIRFINVTSAQKVLLGCDNGDIYITEGDAAATTDIPIAHSFTLYPNPTTGKLYGTINSPQKSNIQIIAVDGREVTAPVTIQQNRFEADVSGLAPGLYFLVLQNDEGLVVRKFAKE